MILLSDSMNKCIVIMSLDLPAGAFRRPCGHHVPKWLIKYSCCKPNPCQLLRRLAGWKIFSIAVVLDRDCYLKKYHWRRVSKWRKQQGFLCVAWFIQNQFTSNTWQIIFGKTGVYFKANQKNSNTYLSNKFRPRKEIYIKTLLIGLSRVNSYCLFSSWKKILENKPVTGYYK